MNLDLPLFLKQLPIKKSKKIKVSPQHLCFVVGNPKKSKEMWAELKLQLAPWQFNKLKGQEQGAFEFETNKGKLNVVFIQEEIIDGEIQHEGLLDESNYAFLRDQVGALFNKVNLEEIKSLSLHSFFLEYDEVLGSLLGLELSAYSYKVRGKLPSVSLTFFGDLPLEAIKEAHKMANSIGKGMNISRWLVDTPPNLKRPKDYADAVSKLFQKKANVTVSVWDEKKLKKENMGMMLAVGQGSIQLPRLVHIKYRPKKARSEKPLAFVGKGITFDSGGLDIKPSSNMRLMKKDMGGSASIVGLAYWAVQSKSEMPCDFYLALAENSVDAHSFRPSDIVTARNGLKVEIDNTDAEGRLVLGDTLALATSKKGKEKPQMVIDVATLTGAVKVGLGSDIAGLFSNNDDLAFMLQSCSQLAGDKAWRLPLMASQRKKLKSSVADLSNSASGFGGAIRAAMFLKEFVGDTPWAHLDIYSWNDSQNGPFFHSGGNAQMVQCLAQFISQA